MEGGGDGEDHGYLIGVIGVLMHTILHILDIGNNALVVVGARLIKVVYLMNARNCNANYTTK
jgi:hypothetical protein